MLWNEIPCHPDMLSSIAGCSNPCNSEYGQDKRQFAQPEEFGRSVHSCLYVNRSRFPVGNVVQLCLVQTWGSHTSLYFDTSPHFLWLPLCNKLCTYVVTLDNTRCRCRSVLVSRVACFCHRTSTAFLIDYLLNGEQSFSHGPRA